VIVLASASPRRQELLRAAGIAFEVVPSVVDEDLALALPPFELARELARAKARAVARPRTGRADFVLAADTVVLAPRPDRPGEFDPLGKPADEREARAMLARLSGTRHAVVTGVCAVRASDGAERAGEETTWVHMRPIAPAEIAAYAASGEWRDKAGGYAIQETADRFVVALEDGGYDNVVGLPVALSLEMLAGLGCPGLPPALAGGRSRG
jgi:septum formation protein